VAIQFSPLPLHLFEPRLRSHIEHLNLTLRDLAGLEASLTSPIQNTKRSDASIVLNATPQVSVTRLVPSITNIINGSSSAIGAPSLTFSTTNAVGTTTTVVSINSTLKFPQAIMALGTALTLTLTNDATSGALLTGSSGFTVGAISLYPSLGPTPLKIDATAVRRASSDFATLTNGKGYVMVDGLSHYWRLAMSAGGIPYFHDTGTSAP
jgi:hypothetical protein